jgi:ankyrin repeat protein
MSASQAERPKVNAPSKWPCELMRIISACDDDEWEAVHERLASHPSEAHFRGQHYGQTALHCACLRYPPLRVVEALLEEAPEICERPNDKGETPLHLANYGNGASEEVQLALIKAAPSAITAVDQYGDSPLHLAATNGATFNVFRAMVIVCPELVNLPNQKRRTPFSLLSRAYLDATCLEDLEDEEIAEDWEIAMLFLRASFPNFPEGHAVAGSPGAPRALLKTIIKFFPSHATTYHEGLTPLLLAACSPVHDEAAEWSEHEDGYREHDDDSEAEEQYEDTTLVDETLLLPYQHLKELQPSTESSVLKLIVEWNPDAAKMSDAQGRLPLTLALMHNKPWEKGVEALVLAAPRALETRDIQSGLYPFQVAATHCDDLATIFHLLRSFPQHVMRALEVRRDSELPTPIKKRDSEFEAGKAEGRNKRFR